MSGSSDQDPSQVSSGTGNGAQLSHVYSPLLIRRLTADPNSEIMATARDGPRHDLPVEQGPSNVKSGHGYGQGSTGGGDFRDDPALAESYENDDYYGEPGYGTGRPDVGGPMGGMDSTSGLDRRGLLKMGLAAGVGGRSTDGTERRVPQELGYGTGTPDEGGPIGGMDTVSGVNRRGEIITGLG